MSNKAQQLKDTLPENFESLDGFWDFWDTRSSADFEDEMEDVNAVIELSSSKVYFAVAKDFVRPIRAQAREQGVSPETLLNLWLKEKISV